MYKLILALFSILYSLTALSSNEINYVNISDLSKTDRVALVEHYKEFLISLELVSDAQEEKQTVENTFMKYLKNFFLAYAGEVGTACVYAGWPSSFGDSGFCLRPEYSEEYKSFNSLSLELGFETDSPVGFEKCEADQRQCNPALFGPVCAPFDTKHNRVRATSNCGKASLSSFPNGFDYKSFVADNINPENQDRVLDHFEHQFEKVQDIASTVCNDETKKQSKTAVCRVLADRLSREFPHHSKVQAGGSGGADQVILPSDLDTLEEEINGLSIEIDRVLKSENCTDPSVSKVVDERYNTRQLIDPNTGEFLSDEGSLCVKELKPLLNEREHKLNEYRQILSELNPTANRCHDSPLLSEQDELHDQISKINSIVAKKACEENPAEKNVKNCSKDFLCAMGSSLFVGSHANKVGAYFGKKLGFDESCLNSQNNCLTKIASAAGDIVWSFLKSLPQIGALAWNGAKKVGGKIKGWLPWVTSAEKKLSEANHAAANILGEDQKSTFSKISEFLKNLWNIIQRYISHDLMCTEPGWEVERFKKDAKCDAPFVSWKCLSCAGAISGACNVIGAVGSELIIGVLTGGTATAVKSGARALSIGVKAGTRKLLSSQLKGISGNALKLGAGTVKAGVTLARTPFILTLSALSHSRVFLDKQARAFSQVGGWVKRNANKIVTPIIPKSRFVQNTLAVTGNGARKVGEKLRKGATKAVLLPFKLPWTLVKATGRVLDPLKLGEKGFALGFNVSNKAISSARFLRITNFNYELSNAVNAINKSSSPQKAVDAAIGILRKSNKEANEWIKAAQAGELTVEEYRQLKKILEIQTLLTSKVRGIPAAEQKLSIISKKLNKNLGQLDKVLGQGGILRYEKYSLAHYQGLPVKKIRNINSNLDTDITGVNLLKTKRKDIVLTIEPGKSEVLVLDYIDGSYLAVNKAGEEILISSGNLSRKNNKAIRKKLDGLTDEQRYLDIEKLGGSSGGAIVSDRISNLKKAEDGAHKSYKRAYNQLSREIQKPGSSTVSIADDVLEDFSSNASVVNSQLVGAKKVNSISDQYAFLSRLQKRAAPDKVASIDSHKRALIDSLPSEASRNIVLNRSRGPALEGKFTGSRTNNISFYEKSATGQKYSRSIKAKISADINGEKIFLRLDHKNSSKGVRLVDETPNSFVGYDGTGSLVHIRKNLINKKLRSEIAANLEKVSPADKDILLKSANGSNRAVVYPRTNPDFRFSKPLAKNEVRVGDSVISLRRNSLNNNNLATELVEGGAINLKVKPRDTITVNNIKELGEYWVGKSSKSGKEVIIPKFLVDARTNALASRSYNFTKFKQRAKKHLSFVTKFRSKGRAVDVDKAFRAKYKYQNFLVKYVAAKEEISNLEISALEKISKNVYLRAIDESNAEIFYVDESEALSNEEQASLDQAFEEALDSDSEYDFDNENLEEFEF